MTTQLILPPMVKYKDKICYVCLVEIRSYDEVMDKDAPEAIGEFDKDNIIKIGDTQ